MALSLGIQAFSGSAAPLALLLALAVADPHITFSLARGRINLRNLSALPLVANRQSAQRDACERSRYHEVRNCLRLSPLRLPEFSFFVAVLLSGRDAEQSEMTLEKAELLPYKRTGRHTIG